MNNIVISSVCLNEDIDPEEASFHFWLLNSKEWIDKHGINIVIEMMMRSSYKPLSFYDGVSND